MDDTKPHNLAVAKPATVKASALRSAWKDKPLTPARPSTLAAVPATIEQKYQRREFYLKIDGLTGPRPKNGAINKE